MSPWPPWTSPALTYSPAEESSARQGAACSLLRRGRRVEVVEASSVPVGIMPQVEFAAYSRELAPGDVVVLLSDGVTACGQEWLEDLVLHWDEEENPNLLAQRITGEAL